MDKKTLSKAMSEAGKKGQKRFKKKFSKKQIQEWRRKGGEATRLKFLKIANKTE